VGVGLWGRGWGSQTCVMMSVPEERGSGFTGYAGKWGGHAWSWARVHSSSGAAPHTTAPPHARARPRQEVGRGIGPGWAVRPVWHRPEGHYG
jgi:hypothetical protein